MGELTTCNYCSLQAIKQRAKENNLKVTLLQSNWELGGIDVYVHPKDVKVRKLDDRERKKYKVAWFMELSDHCCC